MWTSAAHGIKTMDLLIHYLNVYLLAVFIYFAVIIPRQLFKRPNDRKWTFNYFYLRGISFKKRIFVFILNTLAVFIILFLGEIISGKEIPNWIF